MVLIIVIISITYCVLCIMHYNVHSTPSEYNYCTIILCNLQAETWANNYTARGGSTSGQTYELFNKMRQERPSGRTTRRQNLQFLHFMYRPK